jgi:membrane protease YdiL (CAAX protease family)
LGTKNLGSNLFLAVKLIFIIQAVEVIIVLIFESIGISFEGDPGNIDIFFIISAVIVAPIFEETVYRANASTLLARRIPILWVAGITGTWFILKHLPMWHLDNEFGLPALAVFVPVDVIIWIVVTYYFLKRKCIWIPVIIHVFNNGSIAAFNFIPDQIGEYINFIKAGIGIVFIIIFVVPKLNKIIHEKFLAGKFKFTDKDKYFLQISIGFTLLLLATSEAIVFIMGYNPTGSEIPVGIIVCGIIGLIFFILSIFTIIYVYVNNNIVYIDT